MGWVLRLLLCELELGKVNNVIVMSIVCKSI